MDRALDPNYDPDSPTNANATATTGGAAPSTEPLLADLSASTAPPAKAI